MYGLLSLLNQHSENPPFVDDVPIQTVFFFSSAMFVFQIVYDSKAQGAKKNWPL